MTIWLGSRVRLVWRGLWAFPCWAAWGLDVQYATDPAQQHVPYLGAVLLGPIAIDWWKRRHAGD